MRIIELAYEGRLDMFKAIFGGGEKTDGEENYVDAAEAKLDPDNLPRDARGNRIKLSTAAFDATFSKSPPKIRVKVMPAPKTITRHRKANG